MSEVTSRQVRQDVDLSVETHIDAPPAEVFERVADPTRFPRPDDGLVTVDGVVERVPDTYVSFSVTADGRPGIVEVHLAPEDGGTRVRVRHRIDADAPAAALRGHWAASLRALEVGARLRRGVPMATR